jgi:O-acetyl-ADP-ribose deacetylase (regulator of RNase III)
MDFTIILGDITTFHGTAIVNAANNSLLGGGGVDGAIHKAAGPKLLEFNRGLGGCPTGEARLSPGFNLSVPWVISTVGPVYQDGQQGEAQLLFQAYQSVYRICRDEGFDSVAFPAISCGVYGYPWDKAAQIALQAFQWAEERQESPAEVYFYCFSEEMEAVYKKVFAFLNK